MFDLRAVVIATSLILASIAVAAAETAPDQPAKVAASTADTARAARPLRVILPAPWEPAPASSGAQTVVQK